MFGTASCSSDEILLQEPTVSVSDAGTWTDIRDGHVYRVVRIGQQEWLAENLAYYLPTGTAGGSFTWGEKENDYKLENVTFLPDTLQVEITDSIYGMVYESVVADPAHDWQAESGVSTEQLREFFVNYYSLYGQEAFTSTMAYYAAFHQVLTAALEAKRESMRGEVVAAKTEKIQQMVTRHRDAAETANGGYSATYGYLYSLDGARAAVPEEGDWRLPTDADWQQLEGALGMSPEDQQLMNAWRGEGAGTMLLPGGKAGFDVLFGGCNAYLHTNELQYIRKGQCAYFWTDDETTTSEEQEVEGEGGETSVETFVYRIGTIRQLAAYSRGIWRGTTRTDNNYRHMTYSVRLVRNL